MTYSVEFSLKFKSICASLRVCVYVCVLCLCLGVLLHVVAMRMSGARGKYAIHIFQFLMGVNGKVAGELTAYIYAAAIYSHRNGT